MMSPLAHCGRVSQYEHSLGQATFHFPVEGELAAFGCCAGATSPNAVAYGDSLGSCIGKPGSRIDP